MEQLIGSRLRKKYDRAVCCHPVFLNLNAEHIKRNARLDELQARIKIDRRNISNFRYADDTTLHKGELKNLLIRVKEESIKAGLKFNIQKMKTIASSPITSWQIEEEKVETVADFMFLGSQITRMVTVTMQSKDTCSLEGKP